MDIDSHPDTQTNAITREITALYRQRIEDPDIENGPDGRLFLLRQAATVMMIAASTVKEPTDAMREQMAENHTHAVEAAWDLLQYDRLHGTSCGAVPASDEQWDTDTAGYVRQEYRVWRAEKQ
ncbi:hypothetical protein [Streptomyces sp. NPDC048157]|uniref:hypothetical protein n=1 Tax=Streptomyces sp. NPDC048157 TaxID=3365503 RepID=UPI0037158707